MFSIVEAEIAAEDKHRTNTIEQQNLEKYHEQLNSFNTQATLILGFALASLNADNLIALGDDQSKYCLYKQPGWGFLFGISIPFQCNSGQAPQCRVVGTRGTPEFTNFRR